MEEDIIEPVMGQPTEWVSQLVLVLKPSTGDIRICADNREVNKAIIRERHVLPTVEEIVA